MAQILEEANLKSLTLVESEKSLVTVRLKPDAKKLGQQLKYADRRGFRVALIAGGNEFQACVCQVKNLQTGEKQDIQGCFRVQVLFRGR